MYNNFVKISAEELRVRKLLSKKNCQVKHNEKGDSNNNDNTNIYKPVFIPGIVDYYVQHFIYSLQLPVMVGTSNAPMT